MSLLLENIPQSINQDYINILDFGEVIFIMRTHCHSIRLWVVKAIQCISILEICWKSGILEHYL